MSSEQRPEHADDPQPVTLTRNEICLRIIIWIVSLVIIVVNVAVDILTLILYYDSEEYVFFAFTLTFLSLPPLIIAVASLIWLWDQDKSLEDENIRAEHGQFTTTSVVLHLALLGLAYRLVI